MNLNLIFLLSCTVSLTFAGDSAKFEPAKKVGEQTLLLNGIGERTATFFAIKVYDAAFYNPVRVNSTEEALRPEFPKRLDIRYVRDFNLKDTTEAWKYQFKESSELDEALYKNTLEQFLAVQKPIQKFDTHTLVFEQDGIVKFMVNEQKLVEIKDINFQKAFLNIFFGKNPPTRELQRGLIQGDQSS